MIKSHLILMILGENDSRRWSNFLQTHIFWNFGHISRIYNQINYSSIWFLKVIMILVMTTQVLFFNDFSEKDQNLNAVQYIFRHIFWKFLNTSASDNVSFLTCKSWYSSNCFVSKPLQTLYKFIWKNTFSQQGNKLTDNMVRKYVCFVKFLL